MDTTLEYSPGLDNLHDKELENAVVASLINSSSSYERCRDILTDECFYHQKTRDIFRAFRAVVDRGDVADLIIVGRELAEMKSAVSKNDLAAICINSPLILDLRSHALLLKEYCLRRKLWTIGYNLMQKGADMGESLESIHGDAKKNIDSLFEDNTADMLTMADAYKELQEDIIVRSNMPEGVTTGTPTGFGELDRNGGLNGSDLIVVGAETSMGKTSFATAMAMNAISNGNPVAFYSMEMTPKQLTARIASMRTGISASKIQYGKLSMGEIYRIDNAMQDIDGCLMHFDGRSVSSLEGIMMSIRSMKAKHDIKGAVVDYLQLVNVSDKKLTREQAVARIAQDLKNLAKSLDIWIIAISQLSRNSQNPFPTLARLRDSGQIEQAADTVILIYRPRDGGNYPAPFTDMPTMGTAMVDIAKGRNIGTNKFICGFRPENTLFYPIDNTPMFARNVTQDEEPF